MNTTYSTIKWYRKYSKIVDYILPYAFEQCRSTKSIIRQESSGDLILVYEHLYEHSAERWRHEKREDDRSIIPTLNFMDMHTMVYEKLSDYWLLKPILFWAQIDKKTNSHSTHTPQPEQVSREVVHPPVSSHHWIPTSDIPSRLPVSRHFCFCHGYCARKLRSYCHKVILQ